MSGNTILRMPHLCRINAALGSNFANTVLLTTVTIVSTQLARQVVAFERWHPRHVTNVRC